MKIMKVKQPDGSIVAIPFGLIGGSSGKSAYEYALDAGYAGTENEFAAALASIGNNLSEETDPTVPSHVKKITTDDILNWNNKSNFDGDYNKLTNTPTIPNAYTHPSHTEKPDGLYRITVDTEGHVSGTNAVTKDDITKLGIPAQDTVYTHPDTHAANMITGLATVATSGNYNDLTNKPAAVSIDTALSSTSTNSVQNKVITAALNEKAAAEHSQASDTINAMTGYSKATSASAISTSDSLNTAIGKLEKALETKQASGSYAPADHSHNDNYYTESEVDAKVTISGKVTKALGGIAKDTTYTNASLIDVLSDLLFPYVAPVFNSISTTEGSGTLEYGTTRTITKVTPNFTAGSKAINSVKIGTTSGGNDLYSGTSATNGSAITLTTSKSYNGSTGGTIYCTLSDGTTTTTKSATVSYAYFTYYAVTDTTAAPTSWTAVGSTSVSDISIAANAGQYIWIASPNSYSGICELNELSGKYNSAATTVKTSSQSLTNSKNYACTNKYYFYRLQDPRAGSGTSKFKLA